MSVKFPIHKQQYWDVLLHIGMRMMVIIETASFVPGSPSSLASYPRSSLAEKPVFLQGRSLGTRLKQLTKRHAMHLCVLVWQFQVCAYLPSLTAHGRRVWLGQQSFAQGPPDRVPLHWFDLWPLSCHWGWGVSVPQGCSFSLQESRHGGCMECKGGCEGRMHA